MKKKYCFDIDGIICTTQKNNYKYSKPNLKIIKIINTLYKKNIIILHTARYMGRSKDNQKQATKRAKTVTLNQLKKWNVKYHKIFFGKPSYDYVIDDKSILVNSKLNKKITSLLKKNLKL
tara:strand:+ start:470 stop:829 length:360 start_codon:yes stop_codon:yes gene_type:complete